MSGFEQACTDDQVAGYWDSLSNWGRWGDDDELGTLNYITSDKVRSASTLVQSGLTLSLAHDVATRPAANNPRPAVHVMQFMGPNPRGSTDFLGIACHGFANTHVDALCHDFHDGCIYNGFKIDESLFITGAKRCAVDVMRDGIVTRGVLLDIPGTQGRDWLDVGERVYVSDLEAAEERAGVRVESGDMVIVRVGQYPRMAVEGMENPFAQGFVRNGLDADCVEWLHERQVAVYGGDCIERMPSEYPACSMPLHQIGIVQMGLILLDNVAVEDLASTCERIGRWEFMATFAPLRLRGGTGSAVNPIAVF